MTPCIINICNLTKTYQIYKKPVDRLKSFFYRNVFSQIFTALSDVSFSVKKGETLGVIGENGAGKSTLLKIISGVITPDSGEVSINGKVLSILELGVGFHPEFSGLDNIFLYGDVLGFSRTFIKEKISQIIEFSELEVFIDKPIKTYSSGMLMRLAFSIVTAFEPDILILDEVLAVGDIHFQRKSLNRILDMKKKGCSIIFCSHDTYHIRMICDRVLWLKDGNIENIGQPEDVVVAYESYQFNKDEKRSAEIHSSDNIPVMIQEVKIEPDGELQTGSDLKFLIKTVSKNDGLPYNITLSIKLPDGRGVYVTGTHFLGMPHIKGSKEIAIIFPDIRLLSGNYYAHVRIFDETGIICIHERPTQFFTIQKNRQELGICYLQNQWEIM